MLRACEGSTSLGNTLVDEAMRRILCNSAKIPLDFQFPSVISCWIESAGNKKGLLEISDRTEQQQQRKTD